MTAHEQDALALPGRNRVRLRMANLRLHSSGVFSNVYRGTLLEPEPPREIALKKTWPEKTDELRNVELLILLCLSRERHKNIVQVLYTYQTISDRKDRRICESMIFDFMPGTLTAIIPELFGPPLNVMDVKLYTWQLFNGLYFLLRKRICHRDIKPQNILVDPDAGLLKIGDFGSAKHMINVVRSTPYQVTRFYRPPELLLESEQYNCLVDVWSGACCVGEMLRGAVLFCGRDAMHQLKLIVQALGSPTDADLVAMKACTRLEGEKVVPRGLQSLLPKAPPDFVALLSRILVYAPKSRLCGRDLLLDPFFADLFVSGQRRTNGRLVADSLTPEDLECIRMRKRKNKLASHSQTVEAKPTKPGPEAPREKESAEPVDDKKRPDPKTSREEYKKVNQSARRSSRRQAVPVLSKIEAVPSFTSQQPVAFETPELDDLAKH